MTVKELSQLYYLNREIEDCQKQLAELESQRSGIALNMDGMPRAQGPKRSQVERLAAEIVDLKAIIHAKQIECIHERNRLERYIKNIPDSLTRQIFEMRFVRGQQWEDIAAEISYDLGEDRTVYAMKKRCYRYLDKNP
ncbi:MAG: DUF1492 domain-containing protein [Eubacterium sp.]|nr:DUF1492 domain-containing protein [Eubacterium sp.]